jgi:hypothetical protein
MGYSIWRTDGVHGYSLGRRWELSGQMKRILRQMVREKEYITWAKLQSLANRPVFPESHGELAGRQEERRVPAVKTQALASMGGSDVPMGQATLTISPTNPAYSPQPERKPLAIEGSELWGDPITRRFRLATTANEYFAWLISRLGGEALVRDDAGIVVQESPDRNRVGRPLTAAWRYNLHPTNGELEVEAVLLNWGVYDDFTRWIEFSLDRFGLPQEPSPETSYNGPQAPVRDTGDKSIGDDPLDVIPNEENRELVRMYNDNEESQAICSRFNIKPKTLQNRISSLRTIFGEEVVRRRDSRDKRKR